MTGDEAFRILYAKLKKAGASGEQIQQAVNKYLEENPVQGGITCEDAEALMHKNSASGTGILLKDAAGWRVPELHLYGKTAQFTTTGAQLWNPDGELPGFVSSNGEIGNPSIVNNEVYNDFISIDGVSVISFKMSATVQEDAIDGMQLWIGIGFFDTNKSFISRHTHTSALGIGGFQTLSQVIDIPSDTKYIRISYRKFEDGQLSVCKGLTIVDEPYTGGKPSPNPDYPQPLISLAGNGELTVTTTGEEKQSSATFHCPNGLPGIPVTSGGNYTDENGQQWISDEIVCYPDGSGEYVENVLKEYDFKYYNASNGFVAYKAIVVNPVSDMELLSNVLRKEDHVSDLNTSDIKATCWTVSDEGKSIFVCLPDAFDINNLTLYMGRRVSLKHNITADEISSFKMLRTYTPTTTVMNDAGAYMTLDYVADTEKRIENLENSSLEKTIENHYALQRTGKVYQTKLWKYAVNPTSAGEKVRDNAGLVFEPSTDTTEGQDNYAGIPLFQWVNVNYVRDADGSPRPVALEGTDAYQTSGAVDVGAMQMSFWWNWDSSNAEYDLITISDTPHPELGLKPWCECVRADGTVMPWCIGSKYFSGVASDGLLRSQPGLALANFQSHNNMITNYQKKGPGYWGAGTSRNLFQIIFNAIKGATKNSQSLYAGCTSYNFQYSASIERTEEKTYFPLTNAQAANVIVGSRVYVGYGSNNNGTVNQDRGVTTMRAYADMAKVLKIEALDDSNMAVYLDVAQGFPTAPIALTDDLSAPVVISSMEWASGETDKVIGRHDGSPVSNTDGKHPYRVQGREYAVGCYAVASDTVMDFQSDYSKNVYVAPKGTAHSSADATIRSKYKLVGNIPAMEGGADWWIGDITVDVVGGVWFPSVPCSSNAQGMGDRCYAGGASTSGTREYLQGGGLGDGSNAGSACLSCRYSLSWASWYCGGCD